MKLALASALLVLLSLPAQAGVFFTGSASGADLWVFRVDDWPELVECRIYAGDVQGSPDNGSIVAYLAPDAASADKLILVTRDHNQADPIDCLRG